MKINTLVIITLMIELTGCAAAMKSELAYRFKLASCVVDANKVMSSRLGSVGGAGYQLTGVKDEATKTCERLLIHENPHPERIDPLPLRHWNKYSLADSIRLEKEREEKQRSLIINKLVNKAIKDAKAKREAESSALEQGNE